jgi:hypothetical protein
VSAGNKYTVACSVVTFVLTAIIVAGHFHPVCTAIFVGTKIEGIVTIILVVFWTAIAAANTDAGNGLAPVQMGSDAIENANLYYFSWAGFITSIVLLVSFLRDAFGVDMVGNVRSRAARLQWWAALLAASVIVLGSAARVQRLDCQATSEGSFSNGYCRKTKFAIAGGTLSAFFSGLVISSKVFKYTAGDSTTPFVLELFSSAFLTVLNAFVTGYTTSADAPGSAVGNLYYFSWAMFLIVVVLAFECYGEFVQPAAAAEDDQNGQSGAPKNDYRGGGDIEVETFDDNI